VNTRALTTKVLLAACLIALAASSALRAHTDVTPAEVKAIIDGGGNVVVIDVREYAEFCDTTYVPPGHIPGAINMPWNSGYLQEHYTELSPTETTIVVCRSGARSNAAANFLDDAGFTNVLDMVGGMNTWKWETEDCSEASVRNPDEPIAVLPTQIRPNPFLSTTTITYSLKQAGVVRLNIYDIKGHLVTSLVNEFQLPGIHTITWDGTSSNHESLSPGVYFSRLSLGTEAATSRLLLLK